MDSKGGAAWSNMFTIEVQGPHNEEQDDHKQKLLAQLTSIPKEARDLRIKEDTPSNTEWSIIAGHFPSVENLELDSGFNEELNDEPIPQNWPLEHLTIISACGELVRSPFVLEGKARRLTLWLTAGLRFEGPTNEELISSNDENNDEVDQHPEDTTSQEGVPEESKIKVIWLPDLVSKWMAKKHLGQDESQPPGAIPNKINLEALDILENDAIDSFNRIVLALPHLAENLKTLSLRSSRGLDFNYTTPEMFREILPQLTGLETLVLTVGEVFDDEQYLPLLYKHFAPNLSTLRFRGPISLSKSEHFKEWVESFSSPEYLPNLKKMSFALDLDYRLDKYGCNRPFRAEDEGLLRYAKEACKPLHAGAEKRGVKLEPFWDEWAARPKSFFTQVDERWEEM